MWLCTRPVIDSNEITKYVWYFLSCQVPVGGMAPLIPRMLAGIMIMWYKYWEWWSYLCNHVWYLGNNSFGFLSTKTHLCLVSRNLHRLWWWRQGGYVGSQVAAVSTLFQTFRAKRSIYAVTFQLMSSQITLNKGHYLDLLLLCQSNLCFSSHPVAWVTQMHWKLAPLTHVYLVPYGLYKTGLNALCWVKHKWVCF